MPSSRWRFHALHTPIKLKNELCHAAAKYQLTCLNRGIQGFFPLRFWHLYLYGDNQTLFLTSSITILFVLLRMWIGLNWLYVEHYLHSPPYTKNATVTKLLSYLLRQIRTYKFLVIGFFSPNHSLVHAFTPEKEKSSCHFRDSKPGPSSPQLVALPTTQSLDPQLYYSK